MAENIGSTDGSGRLTFADFERLLSEALNSEEGEWTPKCLDPEAILALADQKGEYPNALSAFAHVAVCAYCRREYLETKEAIKLSETS